MAQLGSRLPVVLLLAAAGVGVVVVGVAHLDPDAGGALADHGHHLVVGQLGHAPAVDPQQAVAGLETDPLGRTARYDGAEDAGVLAGESEAEAEPSPHHVNSPQTSGTFLPPSVGCSCSGVHGKVVVAKLEIILGQSLLGSGSCQELSSSTS